ncbi:MAG: hypothetical protein IT371_30685 [Deltaproteobacteria bacterium]|nr:hypothetical protein [Deltaproteobacteria bacterium]
MAVPLTQVANRAYPRRDTSIPHLLAEITGVDLKTAAVTTLYTVPTGLVALWQRILVKPSAAVAVATAPTVSVGINGTYDDVVFPIALTGLTSTSLYWALPLVAQARVGVAADLLRLEVDTPATGTSLIATVYLYGTLVTP